MDESILMIAYHNIIHTDSLLYPVIEARISKYLEIR